MSVLLLSAFLFQVVVSPLQACVAHEAVLAGEAEFEASEFLVGGAARIEPLQTLEAQRLLPLPGLRSSTRAGDAGAILRPTSVVAPTGVRNGAHRNLYLRLSRCDPGEAPH